MIYRSCFNIIFKNFIIENNFWESFHIIGIEGFSTAEDFEMLNRIEKQIKKRFAIGTQVSKQNIINDFVKQKYPEEAIQKVIHTMIRRGELQHRVQRKILYRIF